MAEYSIGSGVDWSLIVGLRNRFGLVSNLRYFVETGTGGGSNITNAAELFNHVWSIEIDCSLYEEAKQRTKDLKNVSLILGNSVEVLPRVCEELDKAALFYLDAHWSGGVPTKNPECPLMQEIEAIKHRWPRYQDVVIIDDARMFLSPAAGPYNPTQWPGIDKILASMRQSWPSLFARLVVNQIVITPESIWRRW